MISDWTCIMSDSDFDSTNEMLIVFPIDSTSLILGKQSTNVKLF